MKDKQQNEKPRSVDFAAEVDDACRHLELIGKTMQNIAAERKARPVPQKNWVALRGSAILMSTLAHILLGFARVYWRMIPPDLRTAPVPADDCPPVMEVQR
jgi:hypothetical protein